MTLVANRASSTFFVDARKVYEHGIRKTYRCSQASKVNRQKQDRCKTVAKVAKVVDTGLPAGIRHKTSSTLGLSDNNAVMAPLEHY